MNITQPSILPSKRRWWGVPLIVLSLSVLVLIAGLALIPAQVKATKEVHDGETQATPFAITPATAQPVDDRISFGELGALATQYPPDGNIYFVTVSEPQQSLLSWLVGRDEPAVEFITHEEKYGVQTPTQAHTLSLAYMRTSEQVAEYVALSRLGFDNVELVPGEVLIERFLCLEANEAGTECVRYAPSEELLEPGDVVVSVDGVSVETLEDLGARLAGHRPGDVVKLEVDRPEDGKKTFDIELVESPEEPGRAIIGFKPFDTTGVELPFDLKIKTGQIGGPSAGLAFTLTLLDELSPGELTGDQSIAVTGTMALTGDVGPIGGLTQKASAVEQAGVSLFIVPAAQGDEQIAAARKAAPSVTIIPVNNLDEALAALEKLGGDSLPEP